MKRLRFVHGNQIRLLCNGVDYFPALESALDQALHEVFLETYIFEMDEIGKRIAEALKRAARRGVAVHLLMDGFGCKDFPQQAIQDMLAAGVRVLTFRPEIARLKLRRHRLRRLHRKLVVIDSRIAFVGGINIIDDLNTPKQTPPRYDYAVRVEGPLLAGIRRWAKRLWAQTARVNFKEPWVTRFTVKPSPGMAGEQRAAFVIRDNLRHRHDIEQAYLEALARARSEIIIASAYFLPGLNFRHALMDAAARGVRVVLLLQARVEYVLLHYASRALYGSFLDGGIEIYEYHKSFMHAKVAVIDRHWATVGSSNIDPFSFMLAREANIFVDDAKFAGELRGSLERALMEGATRVLRERWKKQPLLTRIRVWMSYGLARFLTGVAGYGEEREAA